MRCSTKFTKIFCLTRACSFIKGESPEVPFHRITLSYSYFEVIWIFAPIQQEAKHDQEKISAEQKWKVCWQSPAMFCLFTYQAKIQICCTVKLIPWNVGNLSHLYKKILSLWLYCNFGPYCELWPSITFVLEKIIHLRILE